MRMLGLEPSNLYLSFLSLLGQRFKSFSFVGALILCVWSASVHAQKPPSPVDKTGDDQVATSTEESSSSSSQETPEASKAPKNVLTKAPELKSFVEAPYPESAKAEKLNASVVLLITIDAQGKVKDVGVQESSKSPHDFDKNALEAAKKFIFSPAEIDGKPASVQIAFKYDFTFTEEVVQVEEKREVSQFSGVVFEKGTGQPATGLLVRLLDRKLKTYTDEEGKFSFSDLEPGKIRISIDSENYYTILDVENIVAKKETTVRYFAEPKVGGESNSLTVVGRRTKKEVVKRTLTVEEIRKIPGTQGDAIKVVQNLPGVARIPFGGGGLVVRGSNPGDSGSMINRHFLPLIFHFGGIRSIFPSELLESIDFYPGNYSSEFGRFSGGIIDARFKRPRGDRFHFRAEADVFDAGILLEGPVGKHGTFALSGRRSYIDALLQIPQNLELDFVVAPRYYDYQALYDWKKGKNRFRAYFFGSDDALKFVLDDPINGDAAARGDIRNETALARLYLAWDYRISKDAKHEVSVAVGRNNLLFSLGNDLFFKNDVDIITFRDALSLKWGDELTWRTGFDGEAYLGKIELQLPQPRKEGESRGGTPLGTLPVKATTKDFQFYNPGLWTEALWKVDSRLLLVPGMRLDYDATLDDFALEPRLNFRYTLLTDKEDKPKGTIKGGVGRYSQRPSPDETDDTYGNTNLTLEHSAHFSLGYEYRFNRNFDLDVVGFYKYLYGSVSPISDPILRYDNNGLGQIYGLEVLLKHNLTRRFFGWVSYTLMRSERKNSEDQDFKLFSLDQTHILTIIAQYKFSPQWEAGVRYRYTTGNPQTPFSTSIYDSDANVYVPIPGAVNSTRLDAFQQLDLRVDRKWLFDQWTFTLYFEIQNALNQANPEGINYNYNYTQSKKITGLPIIPSIGLRGEL